MDAKQAPKKPERLDGLKPNLALYQAALATAADAVVQERFNAQAKRIEVLEAQLLTLLNKKPETNKFEKVSKIIEIITFLSVMAGLFFAWDQAKKLTDSIDMTARSNNLTTWATVTTTGIEVDKVFIENPEFQKYFFEGADLKPNDAEYAKLTAIATIVLDYFDGVLVLLKYMDPDKEKIPFIERSTWNQYFLSVFEKSPPLWRALNDGWEMYGRETQRIGRAPCRITKPLRP